MAAQPSLGLWDQKCSNDHLIHISTLIAQWRDVAPFLGLTQTDEQNVIGYPPLPIQRQRIEMLYKWSEKEGDNATYRKLAERFKQCGRQDIVDEIKRLVTGGTGSNTATPGPTPAVSSASASAGTASPIQGASVGSSGSHTVGTDDGGPAEDGKGAVELDKTQKLTERPDLNDVMNVVAANIPSKWEMVGAQLGINKGIEDGIARKRQHNWTECWREVIVMWRNKASAKHPYRWSTIIEALESPVVEERDLADQCCTLLQELHKPNTNYADKGDVKITVSDLKNVMDQVGDAAKDNWRALGSELGLSISQLNGIETQRQSDPLLCISDALNKWRASKSKEPVTWETILVSLCKPQVGLKYLADEIYDDPNFPSNKT